MLLCKVFVNMYPTCGGGKDIWCDIDCIQLDLEKAALA